MWGRVGGCGEVSIVYQLVSEVRTVQLVPAKLVQMGSVKLFHISSYYHFHHKHTKHACKPW